MELVSYNANGLRLDTTEQITTSLIDKVSITVKV